VIGSICGDIIGRVESFMAREVPIGEKRNENL